MEQKVSVKPRKIAILGPIIKILKWGYLRIQQRKFLIRDNVFQL